MSIIAQKITVGLLGFALCGSVVAVAYVDTSRREAERRRAEFKPKLTPELAQGRALYEKYSCIVCHGGDCKGMLPNFNAQTAHKTPCLDKVADSYTRQELKAKIRKGVARVERGTSLVDRAGETVNDVGARIRQVTDVVSEISVASAEQSEGVIEVARTLGAMDQSTQQNSALVEQMAAAAASLRAQADELVQTVAFFQLAP